MNKYKVIVHNIKVGLDTYRLGDVFEATEDRNWNEVVRLKQIVEVEEESKQIANNETEKTKKASLSKNGAWYLVVNERGDKIGSVRTIEEAERLKKEYEDE